MGDDRGRSGARYGWCFLRREEKKGAYLKDKSSLTLLFLRRELREEWGMIAAAAGLGLVGVWFAVRRKKVQAV